MTKAFRSEGKSVAITGQTTTVSPGSIFRRSGGTARFWIGVVADEIIGNTVALTTIDGRPINIGDGVAAEAPLGDGKGDMFIEGIFTLRCPTSGMIINDGDPVYADVTGKGGASQGTVASGVTNNGSPTAGPAISGCLVGFAEGAAYTATVAPLTGLRVVDVKLLGLPLHALASVAP